MPPFDREGALKSAEKALKLGRIDAAITEYVKIVEAQPRDWNSANALGDLYVRAGQVDKGIGHYVRIADHLVGQCEVPVKRVAKRQRARPCHVLNSWHRPDFRFHLIVELLQLLGRRITRPQRIDHHGEHALGAIASIVRVDGHQRPQQQPGAEEQ